jgi:hypothetical protein
VRERRGLAGPGGARASERRREAQASPSELAASGAQLGHVSGGWSTGDGGRRASAQRTGAEARRQAGVGTWAAASRPWRERVSPEADSGGSTGARERGALE